MKKKITVCSIAILLILGVIIRIYAMDWNKELAGDEIGYDKMVRQLIETGTFGYAPYSYSKKPNAFTTPGYPLFLSGIYLLFGYNDSAPIIEIQIIQLLLQILSALLLYFISEELFSKVIVSIIVMSVYFFHPTFILSPSFLLTESLYEFIFMLFTYMLLIIFRKENFIQHLLLGFVFGVVVLIRPAIFPFIIIYFVYSWVVYKAKGKYVFMKRISMFIIGFIVIMSPWWIRNYVTLNKVVLLAEQGGNPLLWGTYPYNSNPKINVSLEPAEMGEKALSRIIEGFKSQPLYYAGWYTWGKTWYLIKDIWPGNHYISRITISKVLHYAIIFFGAIGLIFMIISNEKKRSLMVLIVALALISFVIYLPFAPTPRYFYSTIPFFIIGAGYLIRLLMKIIKMELNKLIGKNIPLSK